MTKKIGFIGGGNMAEALLSGLIASKKTRPSQLSVSEPRAPRRRELRRRYRIHMSADNQQLAERCDIIVLAVKPQVMQAVLEDIKTAIRSSHLIISIAAGIDTRFLRRTLGPKTRLIRSMPNTPALIRRGITGLYAAPSARKTDLKLAQDLFASVGSTLVFTKESQLDWVTAVSGSGPAYLFLFLEALSNAALQGGLTARQARTLALATAQGAASLAQQQAVDLKTLRQRVTSKGGTTEAALKVLKRRKWPEALQQAVRAAAKRAAELRKT